MKIQPQLILLDLDGTLIDSVPDLAYCIDKTLENMGRAPHGELKIRDWVGNGIERLVCRALVGQMNGDPQEADFSRAYDLFLNIYARHNGERSTLYPGAKECLDVLQAAGYKMACVTNKASRFVDPLLHALGVRKYFDLIVAGDTLPQKKPHPAPLLYAANYFGIHPSNAIMIGDSINDVLAARAAGFAIICVSYGYNHGADIRDANPDKVIDSLAVIPSIIAASDIYSMFKIIHK